MQGLSAYEEKKLHVHAFAYRAMEVHRHSLFNGSAPLDEAYFLADISSAFNHQTAQNNSQTTAEYSAEYSSVLSSSISPKYSHRHSEVSNFLSTLNRYSTSQDLEKECASWVSRLGALATRTLGSCVASHLRMPKISIAFDLDQRLSPPVAGRTGPVEGGREITVVLNLNKFSPVGFFAIPWVVSHELWCHCLSDLEELDKPGCSPTASFEEGWMNFVHDEILREQTEEILGAQDAATFARYWNAYIQERDKTLTQGAIWGGEVAFHFRNLLSQKIRAVEPVGLFRQISVDLNAMTIEREIKDGFVDAIGRILRSGSTTLAPDAAIDASLVENRRSLAKLVESSLTDSKCNVSSILKLL